MAPIATRVLTALLVVLTALLAACGTSGPARKPSDSAQAVVYIVPMGSFPAKWASDTKQYIETRFGLVTALTKPLPVPIHARDNYRRQLVAEDLTTLLQERFPLKSSAQQVVVLGLTQEDIYIREETWRYAFAYRRAPGYALVSTARMDEALYGNPSNEELLKARLNKMVAKTIGQIHYHLPLSEDPRSAMYGRVLGPQDLDRMTDAFDPVPANARE